MRKKKPQLPSIKVLGRLEKDGVYVLKLKNWNCAEYLGDTLDQWHKIFEQKKLDITILVLTPEMELLDGCKLRKITGDPPTEGAGSPQKTIDMVTNVDGNVVPKGSDEDDRWGPYGTETRKDGFR